MESPGPLADSVFGKRDLLVHARQVRLINIIPTASNTLLCPTWKSGGGEVGGVGGQVMAVGCENLRNSVIMYLKVIMSIFILYKFLYVF